MEFPQISLTLIHEIFAEKLQFQKLCSRWVPKILTEQHQKQRIGSVLQFLTRYNEDDDDFLTWIVAGDESIIRKVIGYLTTPLKVLFFQWRVLNHRLWPPTKASSGDHFIMEAPDKRSPLPPMKGRTVLHP